MPEPNANAGANAGGAGAETPEYVTKDDLNAAISSAVNAAVTNHMKRAMSKDVPSAIAAALTEKLPAILGESLPAMLKEQTAAAFQEHVKAQQAQAEADKAKAGKGAQDSTEQKPDPKVLALEDQVKKLSEALNKQQKISEEKERVSAEQTRQANERKSVSDLKAGLAGKVRAEATDAVATLLKARGHLVTDADGNPRLKFKSVFEKHGVEEERELDLEAGIAHYLKSEEAKLYVPAPNGGGSGVNTPRTGQQRPAGAGAAAPAQSDMAAKFAERTGKTLDEALLD